MKTQKLKVTLNEIKRMQELAGIVPLNESNNSVKQVIKEEKSHQKQILNIGDFITVKNPEKLPKGFENFKKGDKIHITKIWRNANDSTVLYGTDGIGHGLDNDDLSQI